MNLLVPEILTSSMWTKKNILLTSKPFQLFVVAERTSRHCSQVALFVARPASWCPETVMMLFTSSSLAPQTSVLSHHLSWEKMDCTAGLPISETHTKNRFSNKPEGLLTTIARPPLESSRRGKSKPVLSIFVKFIFDLFFQNNFPTSVQRKKSKQIWIRLVEYSSSEVSGPSEVPRFVGKLIF